ncbi:hypothetical protein [Nocardioides zeae]|uniref:hypothetical protein n=1 Tax=Nocardioides zeae TaxID=1457234 RepID=UPI00286BF76A|nr:hypothetical protein [Nocardioides zeae]
MLAGTDVVAIPYEATGFPLGSPLNRSGVLIARWDEVLWAAITVGKTQRDVVRHGGYSYAEILHRVACLTAYFDRGSGCRLHLTGAYRNLDPSEKAVVSFYVGMTFAKLYADKALHIPWMMHISRYEASWSVAYGANTNRPDLFGCNADGEWAVVEAKGRARVTQKLVTKMQQQKSSVASIAGVEPAYRFGSATRFEAGALKLRIVDPPARPRAQEVPINPAAWLLDYYGPIVDLLDDLNASYGSDGLAARLPGSGVEIGLVEGVVAAVREGRARRFSRPGPRNAEFGDQIDELSRVTRSSRSLSGQIDAPEAAALVERITSSARQVSRENGGQGDGVYVRMRRP